MLRAPMLGRCLLTPRRTVLGNCTRLQARPASPGALSLSHAQGARWERSGAHGLSVRAGGGGVDAGAEQLVRVKVTGRPTLDDVQRLARGQPAKKRGTGSRGVPHRLNEAELKEFTIAKKRHWLVLTGTGQRRTRRLGNNNPAYNTYRQFCDVYAWPGIFLEKGTGTDKPDVVMVDTSPLRLPDSREFQQDVVAAALALGCPLAADDAEEEGESTDEAPAVAAGPVLPELAEYAAAEAAIEVQGNAVRALKDQGKKNDDPEVVDAVATLKERKAVLQELKDREAAVADEAKAAAEEEAAEEALRLEGPVWMLRTECIRFQCPDGRPQAQALATQLAETFCVPRSKKWDKHHPSA